MTRPDQLAGPLAQTLRQAGYHDPIVTVTGAASVGANRATLFIDVASDNEVTPAVAQIGSLPSTAPDGGGAAGSEPPVTLTPTAEAALMRLATRAGVPVPEVLAATDHLEGTGLDPVGVLVTVRISGESIPRRILRSIDEAQGDALAAECGAALARLHHISVQDLPAGIESLDPAQPHHDYCDRLTESLDGLATHHPAVRWGINRLRRNPPSRPPEPALVHGDFRNGNMLVDEGRLAAILDWELAHVGDPMEDLAWMCVRMWRFGIDDRPVGGFGPIESLRAGYESAGGTWRDDAFWWWLAARSAWWAIGLARQADAVLAGESDSIVHAASGRRVAELEYDLMMLLRSPRTT